MADTDNFYLQTILGNTGLSLPDISFPSFTTQPFSNIDYSFDGLKTFDATTDPYRLNDTQLNIAIDALARLYNTPRNNIKVPNLDQYIKDKFQPKSPLNTLGNNITENFNKTIEDNQKQLNSSIINNPDIFPYETRLKVLNDKLESELDKSLKEIPFKIKTPKSFDYSKGINGLNITSSLLSATTNNGDYDSTEKQGVQLWNSAASEIGGKVGLAMAGAQTLNQASQKFLPTASNNFRKNAIINSIPVLSQVNGLFGRRTNNLSTRKYVNANTGGAYSGTDKDYLNLEKYAGKNTGLFVGTKGYNKKIKNVNTQTNLQNQVAENTINLRDTLSGTFDVAQNNYDINSKGGPSMLMTLHKDGGVLKEVEFVNKHEEGGIISTVLKEVNFEDLEKFAKGGKFNVIPEGALHARLHHMDMDDITKKGIPVISEEKGSEIQQQAEIEREEIIFRLEVTQTLEDLCKQYYKEDTSEKVKNLLAIEAGKLLTKEILYNTKDNTNNLI